MSFGAKGQQEVGTAYSGTLWADSRFPGPGDAYCGRVEVRFAGGSAYIAPSVWYYIEYVTGVITYSVPELSSEDLALVNGWLPADPASGGGWVIIWKVAAKSHGDADAEYIVVGWLAEDPIEGPMSWFGPTEITKDFTLSLNGGYRRAQITQSLPTDQSGLRHPAQRAGTGHWFANEDTQCNVTCGGASASGNYGVGTETDITTGLGLTALIDYNAASAIHTPYGRITVSQGIGLTTPVALDLSLWTFYKDTGSGTWHWHGTTFEPGFTEPDTDANTYWKTVPSGNTLTIHRCAGAASGEVIFSETAMWFAGEYENHLWKQNKDPVGVTGGYYPYTSYDDSAGHPFDIGRFKHYTDGEGTRQTDADVSVAPNWTPVAWQEQWSFGTPIPEDLWRVFANSAEGYYCKLRKDWLVANNEDVPFTNPLTTHNLSGESMIDIRQVVTFHDLVTALDSPPWQSGWCTWGRVELDLDKPPGTSGTRPSAWTGSGGTTVLGEVWTIAAGGGVVSRTLATRRRNRMIRFASHSWPTVAEVSHDFPLYTRANLAIGGTGDDPNWWDPNATPHAGEEAGCALEDVTDWRGLSCVKVTLSGLTTAPNLRLTYRTLSGNDPCYLGAKYNFGAAGEASAAWSKQATVTITARSDSPAGTAVYDLAPDTGAELLDLELVELVEFVFPAGAQEVTFAGWETVPYDPEHPAAEVRMRMAHLHSSDLWGAEVAVDGMPNYKPSYLYGIGDTERVEVGYKHTQPWQHNPDYEGPADDPSALKSLARWYNEWMYGEMVYQPTWNQAAIDTALTDVDDAVLGTPVWGDYDEDGFCLHVGLSIGDYLTYCDCILQGGVRGVVKTGGTRHPTSLAAGTLHLSDDGGVTRTPVRTFDTGWAGEFEVGSVREKPPRTAWLQVGDGWWNLGGMVNTELIYLSIGWVLAGGRICTDQLGACWIVIPDGDGTSCRTHGPGNEAWFSLGDVDLGRESAPESITIDDCTGLITTVVFDAGDVDSVPTNNSTRTTGRWKRIMGSIIAGLRGVDVDSHCGILYVSGVDVGSEAVMFRCTGEPDLESDSTPMNIPVCVVTNPDVANTSISVSVDDGVVWILVMDGDTPHVYRSHDINAGFEEVPM